MIKLNSQFSQFILDTMIQKHNNDMNFYRGMDESNNEQIDTNITSIKVSKTQPVTESNVLHKKASLTNTIKKPQTPSFTATTLRDHLFMITVTYERSNLSCGHNINNHINKLNGDFETLHKTITKNLIGGNISRRLELQPFCWIFVDGAATKLGGKFSNVRAGEFTHHHGIMLLHPSTIKKFITLNNNIKSKEWQNSSLNVASIKIEPISSIEEALKVVDYSMKLAVQLMTRVEIHSEVDFILPRAIGGKLEKLIGRNSI